MNEEHWQQFRDARRSKPEPGDVMARYSVMAEFGEGDAKRNLVDLLRETGKAQAAVQVMEKLHFAHPRDAVHVPLMMVQDMLAGMSPDDVVKKSYLYRLDMFFYVKLEFVPKDDPHWLVIPLEFPRISCYPVGESEAAEIGNHVVGKDEADRVEG